MIVSIKRLQDNRLATSLTKERVKKIAELFPYRFKVTPKNLEVLVAYGVRADPVIIYYTAWTTWHTPAIVTRDEYGELQDLARHMRDRFDFGEHAEPAIAAFCLGEFAEMFDDYMNRIQ